MAKNEDGVAHFFGGTDPGATEDLNLTLDDDSTPGDPDGEIALDVYQTENDVVVVAPIAGVDPDDIEIAATDDTLTIAGERKAEHLESLDDVFTQEIYWGAFSRTVSISVPCLMDKASASFKHGILTVSIPKASKAKKRLIKVKTAE
jgi:HSP20 family protein